MTKEWVKMASSEKRLSKSERKRRNQKRLILQAARRLFESSSYDDVSMEEIADEAAVSKQTLYNYFSSKDSIYFGIGSEGFRDAIELTTEMELSSLPGKQMVLKLVEIFFDTAIEFPLGIDISRRFSIVNSEMEGIAEKTLERRKKENQKVSQKKSIEDDMADYLELASKYEEYWKTAMEKGKKDGSITSDLNERQLMYYTYLFINGIANQMHLVNRPVMSSLRNADLDHEKVKEISLQIMANLLEHGE